MRRKVMSLFTLLSITIMILGCSNNKENSRNLGCNYYIDAQLGADSNDGKSPKKAWKSLSIVNRTTFEPGDSILFKSGEEWIGQLRPKGSGIPHFPICISNYGNGELPKINQGASSGIVLLLQNQDQWEIRNLDIDGGSAKPDEVVGGIHVQATTIGRVMNHIVISGCVVRNNWGSIKQYESSAIWVGVPGWDDKNGLTTGFNDVLIENNKIFHSDRNGILVWTTAGPGTANQFQPGLIPSKQVVIRNNLLENIGGDAILVLGSDQPLIERNIVKRCCIKAGDPQYGSDYNPSAAAIWLHHCENGIMQYNSVYDCLKIGANNDGMAYDFDFNCNGNILQYNYSCNNAGGFLLIMNTATNNIVRFNISENDSNHLLFCVGKQEDNNILYNNTFYSNKGSSYIVPNAKFINNIFMADGSAKMSVQNPELGLFSNNCYGGNWEKIPQDKHAVKDNPQFSDPGKGNLDRSNLTGYRLQAGSSAIGKGNIIDNNGGVDFMNIKLRNDTLLDLGAIQYK